MAEQHHKSEKVTPSTSRRYTVGYIRDSRTFEQFHAVTLKDGWLREEGFDTGTAVNARVLPDCLILTVKPPSAEPEVMQALRQACGKLSARKQRQITEFIQVIVGPQKRKG